MAFYELVNLGSGNRVGDYSTEGEALHDVRLTAERYGPQAVASIGLGYQDDAGHTTLIAEGEDLLLRASPQPALGV